MPNSISSFESEGGFRRGYGEDVRILNLMKSIIWGSNYVEPRIFNIYLIHIRGILSPGSD